MVRVLGLIKVPCDIDELQLQLLGWLQGTIIGHKRRMTNDLAKKICEWDSKQRDRKLEKIRTDRWIIAAKIYGQSEGNTWFGVELASLPPMPICLPLNLCFERTWLWDKHKDIYNLQLSFSGLLQSAFQSRAEYCLNSCVAYELGFAQPTGSA